MVSEKNENFLCILKIMASCLQPWVGGCYPDPPLQRDPVPGPRAIAWPRGRIHALAPCLAGGPRAPTAARDHWQCCVPVCCFRADPLIHESVLVAGVLERHMRLHFVLSDARRQVYAGRRYNCWSGPPLGPLLGSGDPPFQTLPILC